MRGKILFVNGALLWYEVLTVEHVSCEAVDGESGVEGRVARPTLQEGSLVWGLVIQ